jgi:hypothetical protein
VRFKVLTAASMKFRIVFWDVLPCKIIVDRRFTGTYCLRHQGWWWWRQYVPLKRRSTIILHGSTSQKTILKIILANHNPGRHTFTVSYLTTIYFEVTAVSVHVVRCVSLCEKGLVSRSCPTPRTRDLLEKASSMKPAGSSPSSQEPDNVAIQSQLNPASTLFL